MPKRTIEELRANYGKVYKRQKKSKIYRMPSVPAATRRAITSAVARARETKYAFAGVQEANLTTVTPATPFLYNFPDVRQGTQSYERVGNKIEPTKLEASFIMHNNSSVTVYARVMVFRLKGSFVSNAILQNEFFEGVLGQDQPISNNLSDLIRKHDKETIDMMYDEVIPLGYEAAGYSTPNARMAHRKLSFKPRVKNMVYQDTDQTQPVKDNYWLGVIFRRADDDENIGETIEFTNELGMYYKD